MNVQMAFTNIALTFLESQRQPMTPEMLIECSHDSTTFLVRVSTLLNVLGNGFGLTDLNDEIKDAKRRKTPSIDTPCIFLRVTLTDSRNQGGLRRSQ